MTTLFTLVFILSCVCIWFFAKKRPDKRNRNISIGIAVVSFVVVAIVGPPTEDEETVAETEVNDTSDIVEDVSDNETESDSEKVILTLDSEELEADEERNAVITGSTNPGASVSVGFGIIGDSVEADKDGKFSLKHSISEELDNEELTINAIIDDENDSKKVNVKQNATVVAQREKATQEAEEKAKANEIDDSVSREFSNAKQKAIEYLDYSPFSKEGLYGQLIYEKFPEDAARYAVDNIDVDWNSQASAKATEYLDYSSFSDSGLYEQLIYEKFTPEQAQYAIDNLE